MLKRAIVRSNGQLVCFVVNQIFSIGSILSWTLTVILAYTYWIFSLGAIGVTLLATWCLDRAGSKRRALTEV